MCFPSPFEGALFYGGGIFSFLIIFVFSIRNIIIKIYSPTTCPTMRKIVITFFGLAMSTVAMASDWGVHLNLIPVIDLAPNLTLQYAVARHHSVSLGGGVRPWNRSESYIKNYGYGEMAYRYWFCRSYDGWFVGAEANGGQYNIGGAKLPFGIGWPADDHRCEGWAVGGGIIAGYALPLSKHWNMNFEVGVGYQYCEYDKFACPEKCATNLGKNTYNYIGLNDLSVSIQYVF